jgi:hypothetical protein
MIPSGLASAVSASRHNKVFYSDPFQRASQLAFDPPLGRSADPVDDLDQQLDKAVGDLLCPQPAVSSDQGAAQGSGMTADLVSVLHRGALPIPLQQSRAEGASIPPPLFRHVLSPH